MEMIVVEEKSLRKVQTDVCRAAIGISAIYLGAGALNENIPDLLNLLKSASDDIQTLLDNKKGAECGEIR